MKRIHYLDPTAVISPAEGALAGQVSVGCGFRQAAGLVTTPVPTLVTCQRCPDYFTESADAASQPHEIPREHTYVIERSSPTRADLLASMEACCEGAYNCTDCPRERPRS